MSDALVGRFARGAGLAAVAAALAAVPVSVTAGAALASVVLFLPVVGLVAAAFGTPFASMQALSTSGGGLTLTPLLLAWTALAWLLAELARRRMPSLDLPLVTPLAVFLAVLVVAAWHAPQPVAAGFEIARWFELALTFLLTASLAAGAAKARAVLLALLAAGAAAGSVGLWLARSGVGPEAFTILGGRLVRAYGTFGQPNPFGGYMNMVWPLGAALVVWWIARALGVDWATPEGQKLVVPDERAAPANASVPTWLAAAGAVAVTVCGAAVLASWSRGAWLAAGVAALVMAGAVAAGMVRPGVRGRAGAVALVLLALALAVPLSGLTADLPASVAARLGSIVDTFAVWGVADAEVDDSSFATIERVAHWEAAAAMWADSPWLGQGPGQYEIVYDRYRLPLWAEPLGHAHNYYLHLLAETGLVGLAGYLAFFGSALLLAVRRAVRPATPLEGALALGVLGVLAATAAHSLVDNVYVHETTVHLGLALGAMVAAGSIAARSATDVSATSALLASGSAAARQLAPGPIAGGRRGSPARGAE